MTQTATVTRYNALAQCRECGVQIKWAKKEDGSFHPPLEPIGAALVVDAHNVVRQVTTYDYHNCDPEKIVALRGFKEQRSKHFKEMAGQKEAFWAAALPRPCPQCDADPGERCINLGKIKKNIRQENTWPHIERVPEPVRIEYVRRAQESEGGTEDGGGAGEEPGLHARPDDPSDPGQASGGDDSG